DTLVRAWLVNSDGSLTLLGSNDDRGSGAPTADQGHSTDSYLVVHVRQGQNILFGVSDYANDAYDPQSLSNRSTGDGGTYSLDLGFSNADLNGSSDHARSDISLGQSIQGVIGGDGFYDGSQNRNGLVSVGNRDIDFFQFTATEDGVLEVGTQG